MSLKTKADRFRDAPYYSEDLPLRERGVAVVSMTPFLGLETYNEDFVRLCGELGQKTFIRATDISPISPKKLVQWKKELRRQIFQMFFVLGVVDQMRTVKKWLGMK